MMDSLEDRMKAAGMMSIEEMMKNNTLGRFFVDTSVVDLESFGRWLESRREELLRLFARIELEGGESDELYEWAMSHSAVFGEVLDNFRAARKGE